MSEITGLTLITDAINAFPAPKVTRMDNHNLDAVLIHAHEDGSVSLSLAITNRDREQHLIDIANEIMQHEIAPLRGKPE